MTTLSQGTTSYAHNQTTSPVRTQPLASVALAGPHLQPQARRVPDARRRQARRAGAASRPACAARGAARPDRAAPPHARRLIAAKRRWAVGEPTLAAAAGPRRAVSGAG